MTAAVLGLGAGGHARVLLEALRAMGGYEVVGLLDPCPDRVGTTVLGVQVLGDDSLLERQYDGGVRHAFVGLGGAAETEPRRRLYDRVRRAGFEVVSIVHPTAVVSPSAELGHGATILAQAVVGPECRLGENVTVNTAAVVEHGCRIGDHVHVATGALLASGVDVGPGTHVGLGARVRQGVRVGAGCIVGAGAVVVKDVDADLIVAGVPAVPLRHRGDDAG